MKNNIKLGGIFKVKCFDKNGRLKWEDKAKNLVVNEGLNHQLDILFISGTTQIDPWYLGLTDGTPTVNAADTLASHTGWTEVTAYTGDRKEFVDTRTNQSVDNSASKASFAIGTNGTTVGGAFLCSVASGTSGTLLCAAAFSGGDKSADDGDTLEVQYTYSASDDNS